MPDSGPQSVYVFGQFRLNPEKRQLIGPAGQDVPLRGKVFDLLWHLIRHKGRLVGKSELMEALWPEMVVEENNLNQAISALRQALGDDSRAPDFVATIKGRGYQFVGDVSVESSPSAGVSAEPSSERPASAGYWPVLLLGAVLLVTAALWVGRESTPVATTAGVLEEFENANLSLVTDYPGSHYQPDLSPNGRMIAFISDASGTPQVWIKNVQRGDPVQITDGEYAARSPTWSPNDDQILFSRNSPQGTAIYSVGTLGSPRPRVVVDRGAGPNYSSGVNAFVFSRGREIWIARNDGRDLEKILGLPQGQGFARPEPALSPDGKWVAFIHAEEGPLGNLWVIPSAGGEARQLTTIEESGGNAGTPEWSADGRYIIYTVEANTGGGHLWRVNVDSREAEAITTGANGAADATLSRTGDRLAYTVARTEWQLTRVDPNTAETTEIHSSRGPILLPVASPDGKQIVFFTRNDTGMQLLLIDADGSNLRQLTFDEPGANVLPTWAGDGESILYYRGSSLHRLNPEGGSDTMLFSDFHWSTRNWLSAYGNRVTYHHQDRTTGARRTVVREVGEDDESELPVPIEGAQWSLDGSELLGWFRSTGELLICQLEQAVCRNVENDDGNVTSAYYAIWSQDGQHIYFLKGTEKLSCCALWRVDADGSNEQYVADLAGFHGENGYYGIEANGHVFYNHLDRSTNEIWLAKTDD